MESQKNQIESRVTDYAKRLNRLAEVVAPKTKELTDLVIKNCSQAEIETSGAGETLMNHYISYIQSHSDLEIRKISQDIGPREYLNRIQDDELREKIKEVIYNPLDITKFKDILISKGITQGDLANILGISDSVLRVCICRGQEKNQGKLTGYCAGPLAKWLVDNNYVFED